MVASSVQGLRLKLRVQGSELASAHAERREELSNIFHA